MMGVPGPGTYCGFPRAYCGISRAYCDSSALIVYTRIYFHMLSYTCPGIFCHIRLYTVYLGLSQVHTWHIYLYTTYMTGLFPCYVIWRNQPYVCCHISVIYIYWKTLLQSISSQYSLHDGITRFMDRASEDFRL
jgi:hypothetical protein